MSKSPIEKRDEEGRYHCDDGPAIITKTAVFYYRHGKLHREDGPAIEGFISGDEWYQNGERGRKDYGPVIVWDNGNSFWKIGDRIYHFSHYKVLIYRFCHFVKCCLACVR